MEVYFLDALAVSMILSTTLGSASCTAISIQMPFEIMASLVFQTHRARISQAILLPTQDFPQNPPHNLAAPRLRQIRHDVDGLGRGKRSDALSDLHNHLLLRSIELATCILEGYKCVDRLARELVGNTDDSGLTHIGVLDQGSFDFGGRETVAGYVDYVVDTAPDPVVALVVSASAVTGKLSRLVNKPM